MHYLMNFAPWDAVCNACIGIMSKMGEMLDISYACANVLLLDIIQPAGILLLLASTLLALCRKRKASTACLAAGIFIVLVGVAMLAFTLVLPMIKLWF